MASGAVFGGLLLLELLLSLVLWTSAAYCADGGRALSVQELFCWVQPPVLAPGLSFATILSDLGWAFDPHGHADEQSFGYSLRSSVLDLSCLMLGRAILLAMALCVGFLPKATAAAPHGDDSDTEDMNKCNINIKIK